MTIEKILEQLVIFDGKPYFAPGGMVMGVLNYFSCEAPPGTPDVLKYLHENGYPDAKKYKVRVTIETEEVTP